MNQIEQQLKEKYSNIRFELYTNEKYKRIYLTGFIVPIKMRNSGIGTSFMEDLTNLADQYGYQITLTPHQSYGGNVNKLKDFYQRFGFVFNKGKEKDFTHRELMHRNPKNSDMNEEDATTTSSTNSPAPERTKRGKANPTANTGTYDYGTQRGKANPISNTSKYEFNTQRGPANPINEKNNRLDEAINDIKKWINLLG
jgi:N-acetylglutamate synthase-like GNAT family acetyltransferase